MSASSTAFIPGSHDIKQLDALMIGEEMPSSASLAPPLAQQMGCATSSHNRYHTDLCDCCCPLEDFILFLDAVTVPSCVLDNIWSLINYGTTEADNCGVCSFFVCVVDLALCQIYSRWRSFAARRRFNERIGVTGEKTFTCCIAVFLMPCSLAQIGRELKARGRGDASTSLWCCLCSPVSIVVDCCCSGRFTSSSVHNNEMPQFVPILEDRGQMGRNRRYDSSCDYCSGCDGCDCN